MPKEYTLIGGNGTVVSPLEVTEDGDYVAGDSRAFNPVKVRTGGGGSSTLAGLTDVDISNPSDGQTLVYDATSGKWVNGSGGGGGGSGVLVVHVDTEDTWAFDKTWQEIYDAISNGKIALLVYFLDNGTNVPDVTATPIISAYSISEGADAGYYAMYYNSQGGMSAWCETANDYPVVD